MKVCNLKNKITFALLLLSISTQAQITIGSILPPNEGSLLDLKQNGSDDINSNRGLGLPRVILKSLKITDGSGNLATTITGANTAEMWDKDEHIGLVLFNVNNSNSCTGGPNNGMYVWNGEEWQDIYSKKLVRPQIGNGTDSYDGSNTYIALRNTSVTIPVKRAFQIWDEYGNGTYDANTGHVLPLNTTHFPGYPNGTLSVNVLWQEAFDDTNSDVLASVSATMNIATPIQESSFTFTTGSKSGNALVALSLNGKVMWQWQIWVPADDPTITAYGYDNGVDTQWFMDRYLGAISTEKKKWNGDGEGNGGSPEERKAHGLYYQWGRPTPFKKFGLNIPATIAASIESEDLKTALLTDLFIQSSENHPIIEGNKNTVDWYSDSDLWPTRWDDGGKTPFDPCPKGWRVPSEKNSTKPWACLDKSKSLYNAEYSGYDFTDPGRILGYFPIVGYRVRSSTYLYDIGNLGPIWSASPAATALGQRILLATDNIFPNSTHYRANGSAVRCIQDN